jgi:hypothetical protein
MGISRGDYLGDHENIVLQGLCDIFSRRKQYMVSIIKLNWNICYMMKYNDIKTFYKSNNWHSCQM